MKKLLIEKIKLYFCFRRNAYCTKIWNAESKNANWEILHDANSKNVTIIYVPEDDYSDKDVKIQVPYEHFEDLIEFIKRMDRRRYT